MRIIMPVGPSHRDDGACFYLHRWFNLMKDVRLDRKTMLEPAHTWGDYDATLYVDWSQDSFPHLPQIVPDPHKPSLCWQSDTHWRPESRAYRFAQATSYGVAAFAQENASREYYAEHVGCPPPNADPVQKVAWLPHAADHWIYTPCLRWPLSIGHTEGTDDMPTPAMFEDTMVERVPCYDLCFVGHVGDPGRDEKIERFFEAFPNFMFSPGTFFSGAANIYHQSALVLNVSVRGELNMRTFEALSSRSFLLSDRQIGMDTLGLTDGVHCALYDTVEEGIEKGRYYAAHDDERRRIADAGWRWFLSGHTYWHRARRILGMLTNPSKTT